jgi:glucose-6-phosphate 1-dehydrogenase
VLSDALAGERTLFAREDYVEEAWRIVDPVVKASTALYTYEPGSWGPAEAAHVAPPEGWRDPRPVTSRGVAVSGRDSTALGQFAQRSPRAQFHQKIDEGANLER